MGAGDFESVLEVRNLHVAYLSRASVPASVIVDVSFDVRSGEIDGVGIERERSEGRSSRRGLRRDS
jgi:ABC-type uncharacterized transport system ATPase subunit